MSGGIGGIGSMGNLGMSQMSSITQSSTDVALTSVHKKKHHGEQDTSFAATLNTLNTQNISGVQSGAGGESGMRINKFA